LKGVTMRVAVRFAVVWLAAWCQVIVVAMTPLGLLAAAANPLHNAPICHADDEAPTPPQPTHANHACVLCTVCQSHGWGIALLSPPPTLPARKVVVVARFDTALPRAPPPLPTIIPQPRGPPSLI
jgi:hypothetical protein